MSEENTYKSKAKNAYNDINLKICEQILEVADEIYRLGGGDIRFVPEETPSNGKD